MSREIICRYCKKPFIQSRYHPKQEVCPSEECQRRRKREYHRKKLTEDDVYRQTCANSRKNWRENNPDYQRRYREKHKSICDRNRRKQRTRNFRRQLSVIEKNNLAIDAKRSFAEVWIIGAGLGDIEKNNLAIPQVLILHVDTPYRAHPS